MAKHVISIKPTPEVRPAFFVRCSCGFRKFAGRERSVAANIAQQHKTQKGK